MFKLRRLARVWVVVVLVVCAVFLAGANPEVGEARSLLATAPTLGAAGSFVVLGGSAVTNTGPSVLNGDLGIWPNNASSITGFPPGIVTGAKHAADAVALVSQNDVTIAYNALASQPCNTDMSGQDLGGKNLVPGVYCFSSSAGLTGALTLNGTAADVWVFKIASALTTAPGSSVVGTANSCNVYWQVGSSATLDTTTQFKGNILALASITLNNGANVSGRALARNGAVTLINNTFSIAGCASQISAAVAEQSTIRPFDVPESDTLLLFGGGIGGLATWLGWQWRKARARSKQ